MCGSRHTPPLHLQVAYAGRGGSVTFRNRAVPKHHPCSHTNGMLDGKLYRAIQNSLSGEKYRSCRPAKGEDALSGQASAHFGVILFRGGIMYIVLSDLAMSDRVSSTAKRSRAQVMFADHHGDHIIMIYMHISAK
ncbi:hypothetical protein FRC19_002528 [Serendipita sp. 401]|nr:hypothetical protein FRC19_002528 [Serendipita sp. 401]